MHSFLRIIPLSFLGLMLLASTSPAQAVGMEQREQQAATYNEVRQAQAALIDRGYDPGPVDGVMGPV